MNNQKKSTNFTKKNIRSSYKKRITIGISSERKRFFRLSKESLVDKFFKIIGYSKELQISNTDFDSKVYIESNDESFENFLINTKELQNLIFELINLGVRAIQHNRNSLTVEYKEGINKKFNYNSDEYEKKIIKILEEIYEFLKHIPDAKYPFFLKTLHVTASVLFFLAFFLFLCMNSDSKRIATSGLFLEAVKYSGLIYLLILIPVLLKTCRKSYSHRILFITLLSALMLTLNIHYILIYVNINLDRDMLGEQHCVYVSSKSITGKRIKNYNIRFKSCKKYNYSFSILTDKKSYYMINEGLKANAIIKKGRLGYPWGSNVILNKEVNRALKNDSNTLREKL